MSGFLNFACGAAHSRSPRGILLLAVLNPCAARGISQRVLSACTACGKASQSVASLSLKQNFGFEILKQVLKFRTALAFFGRNFRFKICTRFKFKDGLQKRGCLVSPTAARTTASASPSATLPALAVLPVSARAQASASARRTSARVSVQIQTPMQAQAWASTPPSEQIRARVQAKFKSVEFKSAIFKFAASQLAAAGRTISKFMKFKIFSRAALKFKNSSLAQRRALV